MEILQNFKSLFFDVWKKGISGVNISEIIIALLIFLLFLFFKGRFFQVCGQTFRKLCIKNFEQFR